jgi:hypothetical protein
MSTNSIGTIRELVSSQGIYLPASSDMSKYIVELTRGSKNENNPDPIDITNNCDSLVFKVIDTESNRELGSVKILTNHSNSEYVESGMKTIPSLDFYRQIGTTVGEALFNFAANYLIKKNVTKIETKGIGLSLSGQRFLERMLGSQPQLRYSTLDDSIIFETNSHHASLVANAINDSFDDDQLYQDLIDYHG